MKGYEYIAQTIRGYGVTHYFYIEAILRIAMRELEAAGVKGVMAHSENAAGYMADGYARLSGRPGLALCQSIGAGNMVGGIYDAFLACSPVIAVTGKKRPPYQYKNAYQEADHRLLYEGITKFHGELTQFDQLPFLLRNAFRFATTGKPRPVHLDLPNRMGRATEQAEIDEPVRVEAAYTRTPAFRPAADAQAIEQAAALLRAAARPVIVAGRGATVSGAGAEIAALAAKADIPVVTTPDGKCLVDEEGAHWAGIVGSYGMDCANEAVRRSDLVLFIGTQASDQTTHDWRVPDPARTIIHIDIDPTELGKNYPDTLGLPGDAKTVTAQLTEAVAAGSRTGWLDEVSGLVAATLERYAADQGSDAQPIHPGRLCAALSAALPNDAVVVADTGFSAVWSATMLRMRAGQSYLRAAGSLGWSFPASLGAKCAAGNRPVFTFTGDGALYYHIGEMETAVRHGINVVTVVNNNRVLAQCSGDLQAVNRSLPGGGRHRYSFGDVALSEVAKQFGWFGVTVTDPAAIPPALHDAMASGKPALVEVLTDPSARIPPVLPKA